MAENETLDLRQSPRWKPARRLLREGAAPEALAQEVFRAVDATLKKLAKLIPIGRLIDQALRLDGQPRELLPDCRRAAEYAQAIIQLARHSQTPSGVVASLCESMLQRFFDQERQAIAFDAPPGTIDELERTRVATSRALQPRLRQCAQIFCESLDAKKSTSPPPMPRPSQAELLQQSLR